MTTDEKYMTRCLELAKLGTGKVAPNPLVGCVIVKGGRIIAEGFHKKYGEKHAEKEAIDKIQGDDCKGATLYVNLEPCSHHGKTPPCSNMIASLPFSKIIIGQLDPNPLVNGKGKKALEANGKEVITGVLEKECLFLNRRFNTFYSKKRPYVILKWAESADGFINSFEGIKEQQQTQVSNSHLALLNQKWRQEESSIIVGKRTLENDNPKLTLRSYFGNSPQRMCIGESFSNKEGVSFFDKQQKTILFTQKKATFPENIQQVQYEKGKGIQTILGFCFQENISSLIVEGGTALITSFFYEDIWDEVRQIVSPKKLQKGVPAPFLSLKKVQNKYSENISGDRLNIFIR